MKSFRCIQDPAEDAFWGTSGASGEVIWGRIGACFFLEHWSERSKTPVDCEYDDRGVMDTKLAFLDLFRGVSETRLRTPFGAHLERPESSFGVESELNCSRIGLTAQFNLTNRQLSAQLN